MFLNVCERVEVVERNKDVPISSSAFLLIFSVRQRKSRYNEKQLNIWKIHFLQVIPYFSLEMFKIFLSRNWLSTTDGGQSMKRAYQLLLIPISRNHTNCWLRRPGLLTMRSYVVTTSWRIKPPLITKHNLEVHFTRDQYVMPKLYSCRWNS